MSYQRKFRFRPLMLLATLGISAVCVASITVAGAFLYLNPQIPEASEFRNVQLEAPLRVYSREGALLAEFGERRLIPISIDAIPQTFISAILDTEDKRFYEHNGIDFISLTNDVIQLLTSLAGLGEEQVGGASTITMQLAKNVSFSLERRFLRKFKEMFLALKIERELTKDEILELYINLVPFGKRAYGAEAAALTYYGKSLSELNLPQLAMLAGIPQRPEAGNPINGPDWALRRRNQVLGRMLAQNSITRAEYAAAIAEPITAGVYARPLDVPSPYPAESVRQQALGLVPDLYTGGYEVHTTLDANMQAEAIAALRRGLIKYDRDHGYRGAEARLPDTLLPTLTSALTTTAPPLEEEQPESLTLDALAAGLTQQPTLLQAMTEILDDMPSYGGQTPAIVVAMLPQEAAVLLPDGDLTSIALEDSLWARPYIDVDTRGPRLSDLSEILAVGDIIRLQKSEADTPDDGGSQWALSQLPNIQGALIALDPKDGGIRALVGGYDFFRDQFNYALQATRQPGSGFKPFVYSAAIKAGVTASDIFLDAPLVFEDTNLESQYRPENDNNRYNGPTRLREALYRSINLVSMRVLIEVGAGNVLRHVRRFGFDTQTFPRDTQLAIGGGTMTVAPIDMVRAYAVLANGGFLVEPHLIERVVDQRGNIIIGTETPVVCKDCGDKPEVKSRTPIPPAPDPMTWPEQNPLDRMSDATANSGLARSERPAAPSVIDTRNTFIMQSMLRDVIKRGTGRRARTLGRDDLAGKTGTTDDAADTWFNGFHPDLAATVWVGFPNQEALGTNAYGSNIPLPIWIDFMETALAGIEEVPLVQPPGVVTLKVDPETGNSVAPFDDQGIFEFFLSEHTPDEQTQTSSKEEELRAVDLF